MSEKVLGFEEKDAGHPKVPNQFTTQETYFVPANKLVPVVSLQALKHFLDNCSYTIKFGVKYVEKKEIIDWAEKQGGEKQK